MATTRDLDRLVSKTELNPVSKKVLREVRVAMMSGRASDPEVGQADWTIGFVSRGGSDIRWRFALKKV